MELHDTTQTRWTARLRGDRAGDAARRARPDDPRHRAAGDRRRPRAASATSRGSSPPTWSPPPPRRRCGASSATATGASCCSRSRWPCSSPPPRCAARRRTSRQLIVLRVVQGVAAGGLMTLAMAGVGDLVAPRERGRYQGYIAATFAVATSSGRCSAALLVDHASWRWVFFVNLPLGLVALAGLRLRLPASETEPARRPLDVLGAALLAAATSALMLACIWGGDRYAWDSPTILGLIGADGRARRRRWSRRERRAADPIVPLRLLRTPVVAVGELGAVPGHRRAVRDHRVRAAVPADDHRREPHRGGPAARPGDARHHDLDARCRAAASRAPAATSASRSPASR